MRVLGPREAALPAAERAFLGEVREALAALDAEGGALAGLGLYIIPLRRRQAREQFRQKTEDLRRRLKEGMRRQFESELERSVQRIREVLAPYARRVRAEHARLRAARDWLAGLQQRTADLRARAARELPGSGAGAALEPSP